MVTIFRSYLELLDGIEKHKVPQYKVGLLIFSFLSELIKEIESSSEEISMIKQSCQVISTGVKKAEYVLLPEETNFLQKISLSDENALDISQVKNWCERLLLRY